MASRLIAGEASVILANYLIHSSCALLLVWVLVRCLKSWGPELHELLWRAALLGPIATSLLQSSGALPHWGHELVILSLGTRPPHVDQPLGDEGRDSHAALLTAPLGRQAPLPAGDLALASGSSTALAQMLAKVNAEAAACWALPLVWLAGAVFGLTRLLTQLLRLRRAARAARPVDDERLRERVDRLGRQLGVRRRVSVLTTGSGMGPWAAGVLRPRIFLPQRFVSGLAPDQTEALLAHELAHLSRRDPAWTLLTHLVCSIFFFQPLNFVARRQLRMAAEFLADRRAAQLLGDRLGLARCLAELSHWLSGAAAAAPQLALGFGAFRSMLGRRVTAILDNPNRPRPATRRMRRTLFCLVSLVLISNLLLGPRVHNDSPQNREGSEPMKQTITALALAVSLAAPQAAVAEQPGEFPGGLEGFSGMMIGRLLERDVEKGEFTVEVQLVPRVWRNNEAERPKSAVGKTLKVNGVFGKWLDVLLLTKPGDTIEFEAKHNSGDQLTFPGEWLRKTAPVEPGDFPEPPEEFRRFDGVVLGQVVRKQPEGGDLTIKVARIAEVTPRSRARDPESAIGKPIMIAGIWGKLREPFDQIEVGDTIRATIAHRSPQSDHFTAEALSKVDSPPAETTSNQGDAGFPAGMRGFRGILIGALVSKDVEKGELVFRAERVKRVWRQNKATDLESCAGKTFTVTGISGKFLDVLLLIEKGDRLEVEAFHNRGEQLDFVGEWLQKLEP